MEDYYGQQFSESGFKSATQSTSDSRQMSGVEFNGFNPSTLYGEQMMEQNMGTNGKDMTNEADPQSAARRESSMDLNMDFPMDFGNHSNMMGFTSGSSSERAGANDGGLGSLDGFGFTPNNLRSGMMMPPGSIFRNSGATNGGVPGLSNQSTMQQLNGVEEYMTSTSPFGTSIFSANYGNAQYMQNMPMSMDYSDPSFSMMMNDVGRFTMSPQNPFGVSMLGNMQQNFGGNMAGDSAKTTQMGGEVYKEENADASGNTLTTAARRKSLPHAQTIPQQRAGFTTTSPPKPETSAFPPQGSSLRMLSSETASLHGPTASEPLMTSAEDIPQQVWSQNAQPQIPTATQQTLATIRDLPAEQYKNAYSSTGFDMLKVLMHVATRKNPEINIGAVDLSCAFVVCDLAQHDFPIIYCTENFERLTGYTKHEILGRNCRFLQSPHGKVQNGVKRQYVDDDTVLHLKNMTNGRRESQVSIINYRKGGQPFMNLLTIIPITYGENEEFRFYVGFQVDLVEQPNSVTNKNPDGSYTINYQRGLTMPRYVFNANDKQSAQVESGQSIPRDEVTTVLTTLSSGESELSKRIWDRVLLENTDDVVFVLSLKGLFQYLSPSTFKVLEYESNELYGTALSSVCHPSDIVPVTRELKDTSALATINVVFRIRRKNSGYMWFEGNGSLHTEQGKGRKSIILVGRERPVYTLSKLDIQACGGIGDNEVWTKLSTSGMFLFVSANVRQLLDKQPEELIGTSIQNLMRTESRRDFMRILEVARIGKRASAKHELLNKRGQVLQAHSTIYPGDAGEGQKPTFIIAQTRLMKYSRSASTSLQPRSATLTEQGFTDSTGLISLSNASSRHSFSRQSPNSYNGQQQFMSTFETVPTYAGGQGLEVGRQDTALASEQNLFDELKTTRSTSWQFELRQMEKRNRLLAEELQGLLTARKKRKRRKGTGAVEKDCANCHTKVTPEWRRGPSGNRELCNSCGLRWAKQQGRISPRTTTSQRSANSDKAKNAARDAAAAKERKRRALTGQALQESRGPGALQDTAHVPEAVKHESPTNTQRHSGDPGSSLPTKIEEADNEEDDDNEEEGDGDGDREDEDGDDAD